MGTFICPSSDLDCSPCSLLLWENMSLLRLRAPYSLSLLPCTHIGPTFSLPLHCLSCSNVASAPSPTDTALISSPCRQIQWLLGSNFDVPMSQSRALDKMQIMTQSRGSWWGLWFCISSNSQVMLILLSEAHAMSSRIIETVSSKHSSLFRNPACSWFPSSLTGYSSSASFAGSKGGSKGGGGPGSSSFLSLSILSGPQVSASQLGLRHRIMWGAFKTPEAQKAPQTNENPISGMRARYQYC